MSHQIVLAYTAQAISVLPAALQAAMEAVPLTQPVGTPDNVLGQVFGLALASDVTTISLGSLVTRTLTFNMDGTLGVPTAPPFFTVFPQTVDGAAAVYSSSPADTVGGVGSQSVSVSYVDAEGHAGTSVVPMSGRTPVQIPLAAGTKGVVRVTAMSNASTGVVGANMGQITVAVFTPPPPGAQPPPPMTEQDFLQNALGQAIAYLPNSYASYATPTPPAPTTIVVPSAKQSLPQPTIYVLSTNGYPPAGTIDVTTSAGVQAVAYTGVTDATETTPATFTGATGGTGVMSQNDPVSFPIQTLAALLIAALTNYFTNTLSMALSTPVVAATPALL
jgi:hypothetical protein